MSVVGYIKILELNYLIVIIAIICVQKIPRKHMEFEWDSMDSFLSH